MPDPLAARAVDVSLAYDRRIALAPSSFSIPAGRLTALIGPNGSGKSTVLNSLAGLIEPRSGHLEVFGRSPHKARRRIAYVLQATSVNEVMPVTVRDVVGMGRYAELGSFGRFRPGDRAAVDEALARLEIGELADLHLWELSAGQRQRTFVAQGLCQGAELLLLDEPVTGLDLVSRELIEAAVFEELGKGHTVVITTHDLAEAGEADHVLLLDGRVAAEGPSEAVLTPDRISAAYDVAVLHLEDGSFVLDDPHHRGRRRHVHYERTRHPHGSSGNE